MDIENDEDIPTEDYTVAFFIPENDPYQLDPYFPDYYSLLP